MDPMAMGIRPINDLVHTVSPDAAFCAEGGRGLKSNQENIISTVG